ncbi:rho GTPase-activating protein 6-like isoform X2 [Andrographis paniculata]|uniref:rho GTPase-activating protein 6-like isoform X2 n=1 Tax=Andrographis paniculata TaxID=175694 RepID=UPI0021E883C9|nr:rho GTPase-activating protein 6-like isoform X2 [Andrographis paniculata]
MSVSPAAFERPRIGNSNTVFKSGPLLISSRGLGWKSWKRRWFVLTRTSLVFYKNDPSAPPRNGGVIMTLGGIDINNSGSVVVREDKKLITVLFPDGRDGRAFTLKAGSVEDLYEWKDALERALAQAPNAALVVGDSGIFRSDTNDANEGSFCRWRTKRLVNSAIGCPMLLALEDIDGSPSFLEKALRFLEKYGIKIEGILRLSADVEEVYKRIEAFEQGKTEFGPHEDAHVIGDCVKHSLRELPSSPVPASSCYALLEAHRMDRKEARVNAMRSAIQEALPQPNRRLLHRILKMMLVISSHATMNRMTPSAVAACMAPLLFRPLFTGECELGESHNMDGDNSAQLVAAANAANHAQAIITMLLEEYENIFDDDNLFSPVSSAYSQTGNSVREYTSDDGNSNTKLNGYHNDRNVRDTDYDRRYSGNFSGISGSPISDLSKYNKATRNFDPLHESSVLSRSFALKLDPESNTSTSRNSPVSIYEGRGQQKKTREIPMDDLAEVHVDEPQGLLGDMLSSMDPRLYQSFSRPEIYAEKLTTPVQSETNSRSKKSIFWRKKKGTRTPTESIDFSEEEALSIQRLEAAKNQLQQRIAKEARGNAILQASLEKRKQALHEQRLLLEQDVSRLHAQLKAEKDLRAALEVGLSLSPQHISSFCAVDSKTISELEDIAATEADVVRLKQKVAELHHQLNHHQQQQYQYDAPVTSDRYPQQKYLTNDLDTPRAVCNHENKRTELSCLQGSSGLNLRNSKGQPSSSNNSSSLSFRKHIIESTNYSESRSGAASPRPPEGDFYSAYMLASRSRASEALLDHHHHRPVPSSTLAELTNRLNFFKERRAQLIEQLQKIDVSSSRQCHGNGSDSLYKASTSALS